MTRPQPENERGAPTSDAPPNLVHRNYNTCNHAATCVERTPGRHLHYAGEVCVACGRLIRWLPKPETVERRRFNASRLAKLAMCAGLNTWERHFVRDVSRQRKLSPRQTETLDRLWAHYGKAA
jgi:hypothetical protein